MNLPSRLNLLCEKETVELLSFSFEIAENGFGLGVFFLDEEEGKTMTLRFVFVDEMTDIEEVQLVLSKKVKEQKRLAILKYDS